MKFGELALYLRKLEKTPSRLSITEILSVLFKESSSDEVDKTTYLVLGQLAPAYEGVVFNMADKMVIKAISKAYEKENKAVVELYKKLGDLGEVAEQLAEEKGTVPDSKLTVSGVYDILLEIANDSGEDSVERKVDKLAKIFSSLDPLSVRFVSRIPLGKLRLGFSDKTVLDALSWMLKGDKSLKTKLEKAYQVLPDVGNLVKRVKMQGIEKATKNVVPITGAPVLPMLAQRIKSPDEMIGKMGRVAVEPKLDGLRLQVHYGPTSLNPPVGRAGLRGTRAFTRNLSECSWMFPELAKIGDHVIGNEVILDCEAVGLDEKTKQLANFQSTMTRRRKHEIGDTLKKVGITFFVFDILSLDGKNLMEKSYLERRKVLENTLKEGKNFKIVKNELTLDPQRIDELYRKEFKAGYEGIMVKKANASYVPGRTGWRWVKMKQGETEESKLADTIDAVVMGYSSGKGKRSGFGVGQFLVGVKKNSSFVTTSKVGTGLTDEQFKQLNQKLKNLRTKEQPKEYEVHKNYTPDYWVEPSLVVEIAADEITKSPTHSAGLALRFPRLINFRDDKSPSQATTLKELYDLFNLQRK
ncbi:MAG: ATP-dependent DNA ligase [bacterium]|nr:ATP-dependent DNA ligase [bacterium]